MEEDYIDQLYNHLGGEKSGINKDSFRRDISTNKDYNRQIYDYMGGEKAGIDYNAFYKDTFAEKKKTKPTQPTSESTSAAISSGGQGKNLDSAYADYLINSLNKSSSKVKSTEKVNLPELKPIGNISDNRMTVQRAQRAQGVQEYKQAEAEYLQKQKEDSESKMYEGTGVEWFDRLNSASGSLLRGMVFNAAGNIAKGIGISARSIDKKLASWGISEDTRPIESYATYKLGESIINKGKEWFPQYKKYYDKAPEQVIESLGEMSGPILAAIATKNPSLAIEGLTVKQVKKSLLNSAVRAQVAREIAANSPKLLATIPSTSVNVIIGGVSSGVRNYEEAIQKGATEDQANEMFYSTMLATGGLSRIPIGGLLSRFDKYSGGALKNKILSNVADVGKSGLMGAIEEGITGSLDQMFQNYKANEVYDSTRALMDDVANSGAAEAAVGFLLNAIGVSAAKVKAKYNTPEINSAVGKIYDTIEETADNYSTKSIKFPREVQSRVDKLNKIISDPEVDQNVALEAANELTSIQDEYASKKTSEVEGLSSLSKDDLAKVSIIDDQISDINNSIENASDVDIKDSLEKTKSELEAERSNIINNQKDSITIVDSVTGTETTINDGEILDPESVSLLPNNKEKIRQLGDIEDSVFEDVYNTIKESSVERDIIVDKAKKSDALPPSGQEPPQPPADSPLNPGNAQSPEDAWKMSNIMMDKHDAALENFGDKKSFWDKWGKRLFERQINVIKALGDSPEAKFAEATMTTVAGARSRADEMFKDAEKSIYKGVNPETERVLDQALFHKRVIQLDSKYDASGKERLKHTEGFNKESSEAALEGLRKQYGNEVFNYINTRADEYFGKQSEILKSLKDNGLIDEATYNRFKDDDYIQRVFLDHINSEASSKSPVDSGLTKEQLKKLDGGSEGLLLMDSRLLLNAAYRSAQQRIFQNKANEALYKVLEKGSVIGNPLKKTTPNKKTGGWDYGESQSGYTKRRYFKDGKEVAFEIRDDFDKEWHDMEKSTSDLDNWLRTLMGTAILKRMATGINATFAIGNIANDFGNVIMFTDTFDDSNIFLGAAKLAKEFTFNFGQLAALNSVGKSTPEFAKIVDDFGKYGGNMEFLTTYGKPESIVKRRRSERGVRGAFGKAIDTGANALAFTGEVSEKAMRLAVFEKVRQDAYKDAGGIENITQEEIDNIGYTAAAKARKTMDFAKGGLWTKKLDAVSPYLNAAAQGTKVAASYVYKNPKKFTSKLAQISSAVGALTLYNMMVGDDEDWDNIPDYEKNNYSIIFMPNKQEDGSRGYIRIKKTPAMVPFLNFFEAATIAAYNQSTGRSFGAKDNFAEREWDAINDALPLPIDPRQLPNKLPPVPKGVISYLANYDFFRNQEIVRGKEKDIDEKFQGLYDENVPLIYKEIGQKTGLSPRKLKAATEMVITTPSTNTIVGGAYSLLDKLVAKTMDSPEEWLAKDKEVTSLLGGAKARVYRRTNPNFANFNSDFQQQFEKEIRTEDYITREAIKNAVDEIVPLGADPSKQNFNEYRKQVLKKAKDIVIDKEISNEEKKTYLKFADNYAKDGLLKREIPEYYKLSSIKYLRASPETKAKLFAYEFGLVDPRGEDMKDLMRKMKRMGVPTSDRFLKEYIRLYSAKTQEQQNP